VGVLLYDYEIAEILRQTPRLEHFRVEVAVTTATPINELPTISPLLHLTTLTVLADNLYDDYGYAGSMHLLDVLEMPMLKHLHLDECVLGVKPENNITVFGSFLSRLRHQDELLITRSTMPQDFYYQQLPGSVFKI
jgi:hypothetical protein